MAEQEKAPAAKVVMLIPIHGPDGRRLRAGQEAPAAWGEDYLESLVADHAAERVAGGAAEPAEEPPARVVSAKLGRG